MQFKRLVCCTCSDYNRIENNKITDLVQRAQKSGLEVKLIPDLCLKTIKNPEEIKEYSDKNTLVALCHLRVAQAFFARIGSEVPEIVGLNDEDFTEKIDNLSPVDDEKAAIVELPKYENDWIAWYPVIDKNRCNDCGKCIDFCLFGVYSRENKNVVVAQPAECKTNCPACSRVCPQQAIIFPKHDEEPFNGAIIKTESPVIDTQPNSDSEEDLYDKLARRRRNRKSPKLLKD